jgi:hypothetical protein
MDKKQVYILAKWLANPNLTKEKLFEPGSEEKPALLKQVLFKINSTWPEARQSMIDLLEKPGEMLGLSTDELVSMALKLAIKDISRLVYNKVSPALREKHPELAEAGAPAVGASTGPGTSFTSTANVATYPVPLGMPAPGAKKKKKKKK